MLIIHSSYAFFIYSKSINVIYRVDIKHIHKKPLILFASPSSFLGYDVKRCISDKRFDTRKFQVSSLFEDFNEAKIVVFNPNDFKFDNLPKKRPHNQLWVWLNMEPPQNVRYLSISDHLFNYTASYKKDSDIYLPYGYFIQKPKEFIFKRSYFKPFSEKKKLVCWLVTNWKSNFRNNYYNELKKYIQIDVYSRYTGFLKAKSKCNTISQYKFYLSFENTNHTDYITEKLWYNAFQCGAIPIVLGTTKRNYIEHQIPPNSFIHIDDFANASLLAKYIYKVSTNKTLYQSYFNWRKGRDIFFEYQFGTYYCRVANYLSKYNPKPHNDLCISKWFAKN